MSGVKVHFTLYLVFDGTPRTRIDIRATSGALDGEASSKGIYHIVTCVAHSVSIGMRGAQQYLACLIV